LSRSRINRFQIKREDFFLPSDGDTLSGTLSAEIDSDIITHTSDSDAHHVKYTDEEAQNAVGTIISGTGSITVIYDDVGGVITISGVPGGVTDHGDLIGLDGDDHEQYHTDVRGDERYYRINFETFTLDGDDISNKYIDLSVAPKTDDSVDLHVYGGLKGAGNVDYTVSGTRINWDSKGWDGILEAGDVIEVVCYY